MTEKRTVVGAVVVDDPARPTKLLACRRHRPAELAGLWEFPGGKVEPYENLEGALSRELIEELDLHVRIFDEYTSAEGAWPIDESTCMRLFHCSTSGRAVPGETHDEVRWVGAEEIRQLPWAPADVAPALALADRMVDDATRPVWTTPLRSGEIVLRPLVQADAEKLAPLFADPETVRYLGLAPMNMAQTRLHIATRIGEGQRGERLSFVLEREGVVLGSAHLKISRVHSPHGSTGLWQGELGYALLPEAQGHGFGTLSARALLELGFGELGLRRITAQIYKANEVSRKVVEKQGMRLEGCAVKASLGDDGEWVDDMTYAILAEEWQAR